jgi:hypothetical protein
MEKQKDTWYDETLQMKITSENTIPFCAPAISSLEKKKGNT